MEAERPQYFSRRHGYRSTDAEITVRDDAPEGLRSAVLQISKEMGLMPSNLRSIICRVTRTLPDPNNWSEYPNVWRETQDLIMGCRWYRVYDVIEAIYAALSHSDPDKAGAFEDEINDYFREAGIGWQLVAGHIETRGAEAFEIAVRGAIQELSTEHPTASTEIHEALTDLSRRPEPDITGAVQHGMAALECVAREACGDPKATLGEILKRFPGLLPKPLDEAVTKAWGYASETGRHVREGRTPDREEAELVVGIASSVSSYLAKKTSPHGGSGGETNIL